MSEPVLSEAKPLVRAEIIAERLNINLPQVYELARRGDLPVVRLGRSMRFDVGAIEEWIRSGGTASERNSANG